MAHDLVNRYGQALPEDVQQEIEQTRDNFQEQGLSQEGQHEDYPRASEIEAPDRPIEGAQDIEGIGQELQDMGVESSATPEEVEASARSLEGEGLELSSPEHQQASHGLDAHPPEPQQDQSQSLTERYGQAPEAEQEPEREMEQEPER